ncbi:MAG: DNA polymerase ligase N-terminal domain-containing protein [Phycisphaerae bacterium]
MPQRFVILHHRVARGDHWDLMLERDGALMTWRLPREPVGAGSLPMPARRIGDHRLAYLTYEGPLSRGRGDVRRIDAGTLNITNCTTDRIEFTLSEGRLAAPLLLLHQHGDVWHLARRDATPSAPDDAFRPRR